jgi:hypothetical protein
LQAIIGSYYYVEYIKLPITPFSTVSNQATFKYENNIGLLIMAATCGETIDVLWKASFIGIVGFMVYKWAIKEGITSGNYASRGAKYLKGRMIR